MADPKITIRVEGSGLPGGGADGQVLSRQNGKAVWVDVPSELPEGAADDIISMLADLDALPAVTDADGAILTDENGAILLM